MDEVVPIEPELQRAIPRLAQNRDGKWGEIRPWLVFLIPHVWIAVAAPIFFALILSVALFSEPFVGTVTAKSQHLSSKRVMQYSLGYKYNIDGKATSGESNVSSERYETTAVGDAITIYTLKMLPGFMPRLQYDSTVWSVVVFAAVWTLIWCSITFVFVSTVIGQFLRSKWLVKNGAVTTATIDDVRSNRGRNGMRHQVIYSFRAKSTDAKTGKISMQNFEGRMTLRFSDLPLANELKGKKCNVIYDQNKPSRSVIYRFCQHIAGSGSPIR